MQLLLLWSGRATAIFGMVAEDNKLGALSVAAVHWGSSGRVLRHSVNVCKTIGLHCSLSLSCSAEVFRRSTGTDGLPPRLTFKDGESVNVCKTIGLHCSLSLSCSAEVFRRSTSTDGLPPRLTFKDGARRILGWVPNEDHGRLLPPPKYLFPLELAPSLMTSLSTRRQVQLPTGHPRRFVLQYTDAKLNGNGTRLEKRVKQETPEKTRRSASSSGTIPTCENPGATTVGNRSRFAKVGGETNDACFSTGFQHLIKVNNAPYKIAEKRESASNVGFYEFYSGKHLHGSRDINQIETFTLLQHLLWEAVTIQTSVIALVTTPRPPGETTKAMRTVFNTL
ncbi:hypothetical protein PR048_010939 [Dryococelus australis]|uniref:Uncharacterized protein n=1 Tax=Dryococelus australis TaxID=614101 RepID=A0ABQ9HK69_9NEOP|nr:hypothetical protein PR048_010939 [Dryococelus australis]